MRTTAEAPNACPKCGSRIHAICKFRDQRRAKIFKIMGGVAFGAIVIAGYGCDFFGGGTPTISWPQIWPSIGLAVGSATYGYGHKITKLRDLGCGACNWKETFLIVRKFSGTMPRILGPSRVKVMRKLDK